MLVKSHQSAVFDGIATTDTSLYDGIWHHQVGLPDTTVKERSFRFAAALRNVGRKFPGISIPGNMEPADLRKEVFDYHLTFAETFSAWTRLSEKPTLKTFLIDPRCSLTQWDAPYHVRETHHQKDLRVAEPD